MAHLSIKQQESLNTSAQTALSIVYKAWCGV
jgi:hypothetical protein